MKTQKIGYILLLLLFCSVYTLQAYTERNLLQNTLTIDQLKESLHSRKSRIPYPAYNDRQGWVNFMQNQQATFIIAGEKYLDYEWKVIKAMDYIEFERSGNRQVMSEPFGRNNIALAALLLAELAEGKGRFTGQLINGVFHTCEMTSWALSAHLSVQQSRRSLPDHKEHIIDLTAGDLASLLSWIYYFMHEEFDKVNPVISERLKKDLQERILDTYMQTDRFWWQAVKNKPGDMVNNWNPWCNFNVLQCALLMEDDPDKLSEIVYKTMISVDKFINYNHSDGACEEGPSYWGHAAGKMFDYLELLYEATGNTISLFEQPVIKNMGEYIAHSYVGNGWVVNFADASAKGGGDARLIYRYGKAVNSSLMERYAGYLYHKKAGSSIFVGRDIYRTFRNLAFEEEMEKLPDSFVSPAYSWFPETEFCYMTNNAGYFVAAKGGYNNESHNHNDVGTFSFYLNGMPVFIDAGVGTYIRQTFSHERYSIWTMQSNYHNLPMINGVAQGFGGHYKANSTRFESGKMRFSTDISNAYPEEAKVKQWIRSYTLQKNAFIIRDIFDLEEAFSSNQVHFLTWGKVDTSLPGKVLIEVGEQKVVLSYDKNVFKIACETVRLDDPRLSDTWGEEIYRLVLTAEKPQQKGEYVFEIKQHK